MPKLIKRVQKVCDRGVDNLWIAISPGSYLVVPGEQLERIYDDVGCLSRSGELLQPLYLVG